MRSRPGKAGGGDAAQRKNFHTAKLLHKALKKAQQFHIRKLLRRLKALPEGASASAPAAAKLQAQLEAAKRADLAALTQQALQLCGLGPAADTSDASATSTAAHSVLAAGDATATHASGGGGETPARGGGGGAAGVLLDAAAAPASDGGEAAGAALKTAAVPASDAGGAAAALADAVSARLLTAGCVKAALVAARGDREHAVKRAAKRSGRKQGRDKRDRAPPAGEASEHATAAVVPFYGRGVPEDLERSDDDENAAATSVSGSDTEGEDARDAKRRRLLAGATPASAGEGGKPAKQAKKKNRLGQRARRRASAGTGLELKAQAKLVPGGSGLRRPSSRPRQSSGGGGSAARSDPTVLAPRAASALPAAARRALAAGRSAASKRGSVAAPRQAGVAPQQTSLAPHKSPPVPAGAAGDAAALHPSWAAKRQQAALVHAQGTKIVFDD